MSGRFWTIAAGILVILIIAGLYFYITRSSAPVPTAGSTTQNNPFGQPSANVPGGTTSQSGTISIATMSGSAVSIPDVTQGKQSFPIGENLYYFVTNNQKTQGVNAQFDIVYGTDSSISIGLFKEPLGAARLAAESALRNLLKVPDATICTLNVTVAVPYGINQFYSGQNLGLSFCPGATALP